MDISKHANTSTNTTQLVDTHMDSHTLSFHIPPFQCAELSVVFIMICTWGGLSVVTISKN